MSCCGADVGVDWSMVVKYVDISGALPDFDADAESAAAASDAASEAGSGDEASTPGGGNGGRASTHGMQEWNALRQSGRHGPSWTQRIGIAQVRGASSTRFVLSGNLAQVLSQSQPEKKNGGPDMHLGSSRS